MKQLTSYPIQLILFLYLTTFLIQSDTFIYPFLYSVYVQHLLSLGLLVVLLFQLVFSSSKENTDWGQPIIIVVWGTYIVLFTLLSSKAEYYYLTYILNWCILVIALVFFLKRQLIDVQKLYILLIITSFCISTYTVFQYVGILASKNPLYQFTGPFNNPNVTAIILTLCVPAHISILLSQKKIRILLTISLALTFVALMVLQCRTAFAGLLIIALLYLLNKGQLAYINNHRKALIGIILIAVVSFAYLQTQKTASTNGRALIWKITIDMIKDHPFNGSGYGFFQKEYNLKQADYFGEKERGVDEKMNASYTGMAYNEVLQQTAMGGLAGGLIYILLHALLLAHAWKMRKMDLTTFVALTAYIAMSMLNFSVDIPQILFIAGIYISITLNGQERKHWSLILNKKTSIVLGVLLIGFVCVSLTKYNAQKELTKAMKLLEQSQISKAGQILAEIEPDISTSEAFYRIKSQYCYRTNNISQAYNSLKTAANYTTNGDLYLNMGKLSDMMNCSSETERYYLTAMHMEPHLYKPMALLMEFYQRNNESSKAIYIAQSILDLPPKIMSDKVKIYKLMAQKAINTKSNITND